MDAIPLRIEWRLDTPWCPPSLGLHLDGLIGYAVKEEAEADGRQVSDFQELLADLPFEKHDTPAGWVWKASLVRPTRILGTERRYQTAKTASQQLAERTVDGGIRGRPLTKVDTVRGAFKNDAFWYTLEHAPTLEAYCVGDPERILSLLDRITHIGKRGRLDHGRVALRQRSDTQEAGLDFTVEEDGEANDKWKHRAMPEQIEGYVPVACRLTPPYWAGEHARLCWRPAL